MADDARRAYIGVLRRTIAFYEENLIHLGKLAGVAVEMIRPELSDDDEVLARAGLRCGGISMARGTSAWMMGRPRVVSR